MKEDLPRRHRDTERESLGFIKTRIMGNGMKKIVLVLIIIMLYSCFSSDGSKLLLTNRDYCENRVKQIEVRPELCRKLIAVSRTERPDDYILLLCLNYYIEMEKCKKESDVPPPDFKP